MPSFAITICCADMAEMCTLSRLARTSYIDSLERMHLVLVRMLGYHSCGLMFIVTTVVGSSSVAVDSPIGHLGQFPRHYPETRRTMDLVVSKFPGSSKQENSRVMPHLRALDLFTRSLLALVSPPVIRMWKPEPLIDAG